MVRLATTQLNSSARSGELASGTSRLSPNRADWLSERRAVTGRRRLGRRSNPAEPHRPGATATLRRVCNADWLLTEGDAAASAAHDQHRLKGDQNIAPQHQFGTLVTGISIERR
mgnify:CR=1 FL=1